jgi:hypothetical protein
MRRLSFTAVSATGSNARLCGSARQALASPKRRLYGFAIVAFFNYSPALTQERYQPTLRRRKLNFYALFGLI